MEAGAEGERRLQDRGRTLLRIGQFEGAVVQQGGQGGGELNAGEAGSQAQLRTAAEGREDVGTPVLVARR